MKEAMLYEKKENEKVRCSLCSHRCIISDGKRGVCGVRENRKGTLYSLVYGKIIAAHVDPIEKKPFFNFLPGSASFSIATAGCNFRCLFCQNADISQGAAKYKEMPGEPSTPSEVVRLAKTKKCVSIAYTYNEPTVCFEFAYDTSVLARKEGIANLYVTNGFMTEEMLRAYGGFLDAANVDLKSFSDKFYREVCGARLEPVLSSLRLMKKLGVWVEVTTLVVPKLNDSPEELRQIAEFIKTELGTETPWHISRFHPDFRMTDRPPTPVETIHAARDIGLDVGLRYVYAGNVPGDVGENTYCHSCNELLIRRYGFSVEENKIKDGKCQHCSAKIDGRF
jgi:pyruvate formate lyase activating enzyme